jgi:hypothetical protein
MQLSVPVGGGARCFTDRIPEGTMNHSTLHRQAVAALWWQTMLALLCVSARSEVEFGLLCLLMLNLLYYPLERRVLVRLSVPQLRLLARLMAVGFLVCLGVLG